MAETDRFAFWLIPHTHHGNHFRRIIGDLARETDSIAFPPHITLFSGRESSTDLLKTKLSKIAGSVGAESLVLPSNGYAHSKDFFKTLYLDLERTEEVNELFKKVRMIDKDSSYRLKPHLSLLYHEMHGRHRKTLMEALEPPSEAVRCSRLALVRPTNPELGWRDINGWRVIEAKNLS